MHDSVIDRCIDDLSSTLELARALEDQLEQIHKAARQANERHEATDNAA